MFNKTVYLLPALKWSSKVPISNVSCAPCLKSPSQLTVISPLIFGYFLRILDNSNFFLFLWKFELSGVDCLYIYKKDLFEGHVYN